MAARPYDPQSWLRIWGVPPPRVCVQEAPGASTYLERQLDSVQGPGWPAYYRQGHHVLAGIHLAIVALGHGCLGISLGHNPSTQTEQLLPSTVQPRVAQQKLRPRSVGSTCGEQGGAIRQGSIPWSHPTNVCRGAWGDPGPCQLNSISRERRKRAGAKGACDILHITAGQCRL